MCLLALGWLFEWFDLEQAKGLLTSIKAAPATVLGILWVAGGYVIGLSITPLQFFLRWLHIPVVWRPMLNENWDLLKKHRTSLALNESNKVWDSAPTESGAVRRVETMV